jgi:eukaryotic-like serine/threonine-protein kinase
MTLDRMGGAYLSAGKTAEAIALFEKLRDAWVKKIGADHAQTLATLLNLARSYQTVGRTAEAITLSEQVRDSCVKKLGTDHPITLATLNFLAGSYLLGGRTTEAIALFEQVRDARVKKLGADHPDTLRTFADLALAFQAGGKLEQALPLFQQAAVGIEKRQFVDPHAEPIVVALIACHEELNQYDQAEAWRRKWLAVVKERSGAHSLPYATEMALLGRNLLQQLKYTDAEPLLRACLNIREENLPEDWTRFSAESLVGGALLGQKKYAEAEPLLLAGYEGMKEREAKIPANGKKNLTDALERVAQLYDGWGKMDQADEWRKKLEDHKKEVSESRNQESEKKPWPD